MLEERAKNHKQEDTRMMVRQALFNEAPRIPASSLAVLDAVLEERRSNQMMINERDSRKRD